VNYKTNWFSQNIDIVVLVFGISLLIASFPIGDYFVKLNSSVDLTGAIIGTFGIGITAVGIGSMIIIRLFFKRKLRY
jgi:hypothetical protein